MVKPFLAKQYSSNAKYLLAKVIMYGDGSWPSWCEWIIPGTVNEPMPKDIEAAYDRFFGL